MTERTVYDHIALSQLRAEVVCAEMLNKGLSFDHFTVPHLGSFRKSYRNDIASVVSSIDGKNNLHFEIEINRDGIYDRLPEGLFHQTRGNRNTSMLTEIVDEHRRYKDEEKYARKFFDPLEQAFFRFSVLTEQQEQAFAFDILDGDWKIELSNFWNIPKGLPSNAVVVLLRIMPWVHHIKGNIDYTAKVLSAMLQKPVSATQSYITKKQMGNRMQSLGEGALGFDTLIGNTVADTSINWIFTIHELSKKEIALYPENNIYGNLLKQFEEIFIPLSVDVIFDYTIMEENENQNQNENVLGFSLIL